MLYFILQANTVVTTVADSAASQPAVSGIVTAPEVTETKMELIQMIMKGGPIMLPLAILLLVSIYIFNTFTNINFAFCGAAIYIKVG